VACTDRASAASALEVLAQVTLALSQQLDPDRLLQQITDALATLTGAHNVVLREVDHAAGLPVRRARTTDSSIGAMELPTSLTMEQGGTGWTSTASWRGAFCSSPATP
jgi:hypothetical protein